LLNFGSSALAIFRTIFGPVLLFPAGWLAAETLAKSATATTLVGLFLLAAGVS